MSESRGLADQAAREVIRSELDATLFVEAGAGSGKTTEVVNRIVALVATGRAKVTGIAAITFTEAAAAELRIRIRRALAKRADGTRKGDEAGRCAEALEHIDEAPISTIHGFCRRILAAHPIEAGLPPRFEVLEEVGESIEWRRRWSEELDEMSRVPALPELLSVGWVLGIDERRIETLARLLEAEWNRCADEPVDVCAALAEVREIAIAGVEALKGAIRQAVAVRASCTDANDRLAQVLDRLADHLAELEAARTWEEALALAAADAGLYSSSRGAKGAWGGDAQKVRDLIGQASGARTSLLQQVVDAVATTLTSYFGHRAHIAATQRRRRGLLTYHDLLVFTRAVLRSEPAVLASVRRRFTHIVIDEFQDTDPLQLEIARLIGAEGQRGASQFVFVGDPKQSIYRFRGADLSAYEAARDEMAGSTAARLSSNFRSRTAIIAFVNACFGELMAEAFQRLDATRDDPEDGSGPPVYLLGGAIAGKVLRHEQREIEAEDCARSIEHAVADGAFTVSDPVTGVDRPARLGDVAILVPRRTGLDEIQGALDRHQIGYRIESASLMFKSQEARDVLALARALDQPGDHASVVAVLRSPAYSIGDDELALWRAAGGRWSLEELADPAALAAAPRVGAALSDLAGLRGRLGDLGPVGALAFAIRERRLLQVAAGRGHAREAWRRIRHLLDRARLFVEAGGGGLSDFADWIDEQVEEGIRSSESVVPDADEDVVRIMTVHGAKGLEFPITILCGFGTSDDNFTAPNRILRHPGEGSIAEVRWVRDLRTSGFEALENKDRQLADEESLRLLYVAATRARDHLVICAHHVKNGSETLGEKLVGAARLFPLLTQPMASVLDGTTEGAEALARLSSGGPFASAAPSIPAGTSKTPAVATLADYERWQSDRAAAIAAATKRASLPATEIASLARAALPPTDTAPEIEEDDAVLPSAAGRGRGRAGTQIGRAVHATLQSASLADALELGGGGGPGSSRRLREIAEAQARSERVAGRAGEVERLARAALSSPVVRMAFASGSARRETYVSAPLGSVVVDGFVDLCFTEEDGSLTVVDYKTDSVRDLAEVAERASHYELQAATYAFALGEATSRSVKRCVLVFLSPPAEPLEHELSGAALDRAVDAVKDAVGALG